MRRLWEDYVPLEREYYQRTGIFPIMHVIVIRRDVYEANRWVAAALFKAFKKAQAIAYAELRETAALKTMLPWAVAEEERTRALMGDDYWSYGFAGNEHVLATFARYHHEQGLSPALARAARPLRAGGARSVHDLTIRRRQELFVNAR